MTGRATWLLLVLVSSLLPSACKRAVSRVAKPVSQVVPSDSAAPPPSPPEERCVPGERGLFSLGHPTRPRVGDELDDDGVELPFAPEVGSATAFTGGFAVGALEPDRKSTNAVLVVFSLSPPGGKKIDLGAVHGDVLPPSVAGEAGFLVAAVPDGAPNGALLRLVRVDDPTGSARITWGAVTQVPRNDSDVYAIDVAGTTGLLAWDAWDSGGDHGIIRAVSFASMDIMKTSPPVVWSDAHDDAEGPMLAARTGGFWAAWIVNVKRAPSRKERDESTGAPEVVDMGPRYVMLAPLDELGRPSGTPEAVTPKDGHVTGFDLASLPDGSAMVAWRDDLTAPGTPGGVVHLVVARQGGTVESRVVANDDVTVGTPSLLVDATPTSEVAGWLELTDEADAARLAALDGDARVVDTLGVERNVGTGQALAVRGGRVLVAWPRGKGVEFGVLACNKGRGGAPAPGAGGNPVP